MSDSRILTLKPLLAVELLAVLGNFTETMDAPNCLGNFTVSVEFRF